MKFYGLTLNLKDDPEAIASYKEYHRKVWPEVERSLRQVGIRRIRTFLHGRRLFMYMETDDDCDLDRALVRYLDDPRATEWEDLMRERFQERLPDSKPGQWWLPMEPVYDLEHAP
jgi:L-rhamnose mutarotase